MKIFFLTNNMRQTTFRLAVALVTFIVGVTATIFWVSFRRPPIKPVSPTNHVSVQVSANIKLRQDEVPDLENVAHLVAHTNQYSNYEYAYAVRIPQGLVGLSDPAPSPQHGIGITLSNQPKSYIWLDGSYNAAMLESLDEAINQHLEWLAEVGTELQVLRRETTRLRKLSAMRLVVRYKSLAANEIRVQDLIIAFRPYGEDERGITYTLCLISSESHYKEDVDIFEKIIKEWRMRPLPRA